MEHEIPDYPNPHGWPEEALPVFHKFVTCEWATVTKKSTPITWPVNPYVAADGSSLDVSTGLTYPLKAERARQNPKVTLLFSDGRGSGLENPPIVEVFGLASVRDADLQANTDRYMRESVKKVPATYKGQRKSLLRLQKWYFSRVYVHITPVRILVWRGGDMNREPIEWRAPEGLVASPSDPAPRGPSLGRWQADPPEWRKRARYATETMSPPVLTVMGPDGWPNMCRATSFALADHGFRLEVPAAYAGSSGVAALTLHTHPEVFDSQENVTFTGEAQPGDGGVFFKVGKLLPDYSFKGGSYLKKMLTFLNFARQLNPRTKREAARRGQRPPAIRFPRDDK